MGMLCNRFRVFRINTSNDEDIPTTTTSSTPSVYEDAQEAPKGPMTRARVKLLQQQVTLFLNVFPCIDENIILPYANFLCILKYEEGIEANTPEEHKDTLQEGVWTVPSILWTEHIQSRESKTWACERT